MPMNLWAFEFPSVENIPTPQDPQRKKKRRYILYVTYILSFLFIGRILLLLYGILMLDLSNFNITNVGYDTKSPTNLGFEVTFRNSYSPLNISFSSISTDIFSIDSLNNRFYLLSIKMSSVNIEKNRKINLNGNITIENINKKNLIKARHHSKFAARTKAKIFPRICYVKLSFAKSRDFFIGAPISQPSEALKLKKLEITGNDTASYITAELDVSKFIVPEYISVRTDRIVLECSSQKAIPYLIIEPIEVKNSVFKKNIVLKFPIQEVGGTELRNNFIRALLSEEIPFDISKCWFVKGNGSKRWCLDNLSFLGAVNPKNPEKYDFILGGGQGQEIVLEEPIIEVVNWRKVGSALKVDILISKKNIPLITGDTKIIISFNRLPIEIKAGNETIAEAELNFTWNDEKYLKMTMSVPISTFENLDEKMAAQDGFTLSFKGEENIPIVLRKFKFRINPDFSMSLNHTQYSYKLPQYLDSRKAINMAHEINNKKGSDKIVANTKINFENNKRKENENVLLIELPNINVILKSQRFNGNISIGGKTLLMRFAPEHWTGKLLNNIDVETRFNLDFDPAESNLMEAFVGSKEVELIIGNFKLWKFKLNAQEGPENTQQKTFGGLGVKYQRPYALGKHLIRISYSENTQINFPTIRHVIKLPEMSLNLEIINNNPKIFGYLNRYSISPTEDVLNFKDPVIFRFKVPAITMHCCLDTERSTFEMENFDMIASFKDVRSFVAILTTKFFINSSSTGALERAVCNYLNYLLLFNKTERFKNIISDNINLHAEIIETPIELPDNEPTFSIKALLSAPAEMLESAPFTLSMPNVDFSVKTSNLNDEYETEVIRLKANIIKKTKNSSPALFLEIAYKPADFTYDVPVATKLKTIGVDGKYSVDGFYSINSLIKLGNDIKSEIFLGFKNDVQKKNEIDTSGLLEFDYDNSIRFIQPNKANASGYLNARSPQMKELLYKIIPNALLNSFFGTIPDGLNMVIETSNPFVFRILSGIPRISYSDYQKRYVILEAIVDPKLITKRVTYDFLDSKNYTNKEAVINNVKVIGNKIRVITPKYAHPGYFASEDNTFDFRMPIYGEISVPNEGKIDWPSMKFECMFVDFLLMMFNIAEEAKELSTIANEEGPSLMQLMYKGAVELYKTIRNDNPDEDSESEWDEAIQSRPMLYKLFRTKNSSFRAVLRFPLPFKMVHKNVDRLKLSIFFTGFYTDGDGNDIKFGDFTVLHTNRSNPYDHRMSLFIEDKFIGFLVKTYGADMVNNKPFPEINVDVYYGYEKQMRINTQVAAEKFPILKVTAGMTAVSVGSKIRYFSHIFLRRPKKSLKVIFEATKTFVYTVGKSCYDGAVYIYPATKSIVGKSFRYIRKLFGRG